MILVYPWCLFAFCCLNTIFRRAYWTPCLPHFTGDIFAFYRGDKRKTIYIILYIWLYYMTSGARLRSLYNCQTHHFVLLLKIESRWWKEPYEKVMICGHLLRVGDFFRELSQRCVEKLYIVYYVILSILIPLNMHIIYIYQFDIMYF